MLNRVQGAIGNTTLTGKGEWRVRVGHKRVGNAGNEEVGEGGGTHGLQCHQGRVPGRGKGDFTWGRRGRKKGRVGGGGGEPGETVDRSFKGCCVACQVAVRTCWRTWFLVAQGLSISWDV